MDIKLTQAQFDMFKSGEIASDFEKLDVDGDNTITEADLNATQDETVKADIQKLLNTKEEDAELKSFDLDQVNALLKQQQADTADISAVQENAQKVADEADLNTKEIFIEEYEDVDISDIETISAAEIREKLAVIEKNITLIQEKITALTTQKEENEKKLKELEADKKLKEEALQKANEDVSMKEQDLDAEIKSYDYIKNEIETVNNRIRVQEKLEEERYEEHMEDITQKAIEKYNPAEHGDNFESYFLRQLSDSGYTMFSGLNSLNELAIQLSENAYKTMDRIQICSANLADSVKKANLAQLDLDNVNANIKDTQTKIEQNNKDIEASNNMLLAEQEKQTTVQNRLDLLIFLSRRRSDPLAFDTNGDGIKTSTQKVDFDIDGDGKLDVVNNSADWVLAFDKDKDGNVGEDGSELFGDNTDFDGDGIKDGYKNGFEALKALAKKEGMISNGDNVLDVNDLKILEEKYGLKMTNGYGGEAKSLADLGITQINISTTDKTTLKKNFDGQNNDLMTQEGATFVVNGQTREYADIWNRKYDEPTQISEETHIIKAKNISSRNIFVKASNLSFDLSEIKSEQGDVDYEKIKAKAFIENTGSEDARKKLKEFKEDQQ